MIISHSYTLLTYKIDCLSSGIPVKTWKIVPCWEDVAYAAMSEAGTRTPLFIVMVISVMWLFIRLVMALSKFLLARGFAVNVKVKKDKQEWYVLLPIVIIYITVLLHSTSCFPCFSLLRAPRNLLTVFIIYTQTSILIMSDCLQ